MKICSGQTQVLHKIYPSNLEGGVEKSTKRDSLNQFHNLAFVELKKANEKVASLQKLQVALQKIQKEVDQIRDPNHLSISKLKNLKSQFLALVKDGSSSLEISVPKDAAWNHIDDLKQFLRQSQDQISSKFNQITSQIDVFFAKTKEVELDRGILGKKEFASAHNIKLFSPSIQTLAV